MPFGLMRISERYTNGAPSDSDAHDPPPTHPAVQCGRQTIDESSLLQDDSLSQNGVHAKGKLSSIQELLSQETIKISRGYIMAQEFRPFATKTIETLDRLLAASTVREYKAVLAEIKDQLHEFLERYEAFREGPTEILEEVQSLGDEFRGKMMRANEHFATLRSSNAAPAAGGIRRRATRRRRKTTRSRKNRR